MPQGPSCEKDLRPNHQEKGKEEDQFCLEESPEGESFRGDSTKSEEGWDHLCVAATGEAHLGYITMHRAAI